MDAIKNRSALRVRLRWTLVLAAGLWLGCSSKPPSLPGPDDPSDEGAPTAEPPPEDVEMTGGLRVTSSPAAKILIDGKEVGTSPVEVEGLQPGMHDVTFVTDGHENVTLQVELAPGQFQVVTHNFPPKATENP